MFSRRQRSFETCHRRRLRPHLFRDIGLCKACLMASLQKRIQQMPLLTFNALNLSPDFGPTHEVVNQLLMCLHA
jgi:hypothetical protein